MKGRTLKRYSSLISGTEQAEGREVNAPFTQVCLMKGSRLAEIYIHSSFVFKLKLLSKEMHPGNRLSHMLGKEHISLKLS